MLPMAIQTSNGAGEVCSCRHSAVDREHRMRRAWPRAAVCLIRLSDLR
jgi:hypothetical protein